MLKQSVHTAVVSSVLVLLLAGVGFIHPADAQEEEQFQRSNSQIPNSRTAAHNIDRAITAKKNGNLVKFINILHQTRLDSGSWVIRDENEEGLYRNVEDRCLELLYAMGADGRKKYRSMYDGQARAMSSNLGPNPDDRALLEIVRRFPLSSAAADVLRRLSRRKARSGNFREALEYHRKLSSTEYRSRKQATDTAHRMFVLAELGRPGELTEYRENTGDERFEKSVNWKGETIQLSDLYKKLLDRAKQKKKKLNGKRNKSSEFGLRWPSPGGNTTNNRRPGPDVDLENIDLIWQEKIPEGAKDWKTRRRTYRGYWEFFGYYPILSEGSVFLHNGHTAFSWSLLPSAEKRKKGKADLRWTHSPKRYSPRQIMADTRLIYTGTYWNGIYFCNLVTHLGEKEKQHFNLQVKYPIPGRALFAIDATTGEVLWKQGRGISRDEFLSGASFSPGPTVRDGTLYATVNRTDTSVDTPDQYILAMDPKTGEVKWKSFITKDTLGANLFGNPIREVVMAQPIVDEDNVYVCTNVGVVAAVDRETGKRKWIYRYRQYDFPQRRRLQPVRQPLYWENNLPVKSGNTLLMTPAESPSLLALDARTGSVRWRQTRENLATQVGGSPRWMIPAGNDRFLIASEKGLRFYSFNRDGAQISDLYKPKTQIKGRPAVSEKFLYLPTFNSLEKLSINKEGRLVKLKQTQKMNWGKNEKPGNVLLTGSTLIVSASRSLQVYYQPDKLRTHLDGLLKQHPDRWDLRLQRGLLRRKSGDKEGAISDFEQILQNTKQESNNKDYRKRARQSLVTLLLEKAKKQCENKNMDKAEKNFSRASTYAKDARTRQRIHDQAASCYLKLNKPQKALSEFRSVLMAEVRQGRPGSKLWEETRKKIRELTSAYGRNIYSSVEDRAQKAINNLPNNSRTGDLLKLMYRYPNSTSLYDHLFNHTRKQINDEQYEQATTLLYRIIRFAGNRKILARAYLAIAGVYEKTERIPLAVQIMKKLRDRFGKITLEIDGEEVTVKDHAEKKLKSDTYRKAGRSEKQKALSVPLERERQIPVNADETPFFVEDRRGKGSSNRIVTRTRHTVFAHQTDSDNIRWKNTYNAPIKHCLQQFSRLIVVTSDQVLCLDIDSGDQLWSRNLEGYPTKARLRLDTLFLTIEIRETGRANSQKVMAIEIGPGRVRWWTGVSMKQVSQMLFGEEHLVLLDRINDRISALKLRTGNTNPDMKFPLKKTEYVAGFTEALMLSDGILALVGDPDRTDDRLLTGLMALDINNGNILWELPNRLKLLRESVKKHNGDIVGIARAQDPEKGFRFIRIDGSVEDGGRIQTLGNAVKLNRTSKPVLVDHRYLFANYERNGKKVTLRCVDARSGNGQFLWKKSIDYPDESREVLLHTDGTSSVIATGIKPVNVNGKSLWETDLHVFDVENGEVTQNTSISDGSTHRPAFRVQNGRFILLLNGALNIYR